MSNINNKILKVSLELSEDQLQIIIDALEIYFRPLMKGQVNELAEHLVGTTNHFVDGGKMIKGVFERYLTKRDCVENILLAVQKIMYSDFEYEKLPEECHRASDIWQVLRHELYMTTHIEPDSWDVRSGKPIQLGDYPLIKAKITEV